MEELVNVVLFVVLVRLTVVVVVGKYRVVVREMDKMVSVLSTSVTSEDIVSSSVIT